MTTIHRTIIHPGGYSHTQREPLCLPVYGTAIFVLFVAAWYTRDELPSLLILGVFGLLTLFLWMVRHHLTVEDQGDILAIRFGPLPLFRRTVRYTDIEKVEVGHTPFLDGWVIRGGRVWNLRGRECVVVHRRNGKVLWIGTDDAVSLARFLEWKIADEGN
jgi:hypothetical protein